MHGGADMRGLADLTGPTGRQSTALALPGAGMAAHPRRRVGTLRGRMHVFPGGRMAAWGVAAACAALLLVSLKGMEASKVGNVHLISPSHEPRMQCGRF